MPPKAKDLGVVALAGALLRQLESLREQGGEAYPPRLRQLAALTEGAPTDEQVRKAAAKTSFTARAVVSEKVNRKPSLDSPVYFKEDAPAKKPSPKRAAPRKPKSDGSEVATRMLLVLEAQRQLGSEAYPPTLRRLAELCDMNASDAGAAKAAGHKVMTDGAIVAAKVNRKPSLDAPVVLRRDVEADLTRAVPALLRFALTPIASGGKGKPTETTAFTFSEVQSRLVPELQKPFLSALERGFERQELPEDVAWVVTKGKSYLFLVENIRPGATRLSLPAFRTNPARPVRDFAEAFREAFEQLDRHNGASNFVKLANLRRALAEFGRDEFDAGLRTLRVDGEFSLNSHEGLHGALTPEEREAGVREAGSLLVYVSKR